MMDRSTTTMRYQAWKRDLKTSPPQYHSSTVFEDASPEVVRDFFWDDDFRTKWDDMLAYSAILDECSITGTMLFLFFCSDREYIIGRRIWESGRSYFYVTKGWKRLVPYEGGPICVITVPKPTKFSSRTTSFYCSNS
ncbi:mammalianARD2 lipid-binding START domain protein [Populus alba x Populus x berolinensis]|nr:mammalianARD2 lipid-binding START domain protein [Populus alba x Populus x berolinensis]